MPSDFTRPQPQTPEPWLVGGHGIITPPPEGETHCRTCRWNCYAGNTCFDFYGGELVAESMTQADAERAVICVNALAGIPSGALAEGWASHALALIGDAWLHLHETGDDADLEERLRQFILVNRATVVSRARQKASPTWGTLRMSQECRR